MTHVGTQLTPFGICSTIGELNQIECIIDIRLKVIYCYMANGLILVVVLELTSQSATQHRKCLSSDLLREQEELIEAQSVALVVVREQTVRESVVPAVLVQRSVLCWSHGVLPLVTTVQVGSFHDTSTREAEHARVQVLEILDKISTKQSFPCISREQTHMVEVNRALSFKVDTHQPLCIGPGRLQSNGVFLPVVTCNGYLLLGHHLIITAHQFHTDLRRSCGTRINREMIIHALLQSHTEETPVLQSGELITMSRFLQGNIVRITIKCRIGIIHLNFSKGVPTHQLLRELKRAVLHHLGIESTIGSKVDILEEDAVHG